MDFAARGIVKAHFRLEKMENLAAVRIKRNACRRLDQLTCAEFQVFQEMKDGKLKYVISISLIFTVLQVVPYLSRAVLNVKIPGHDLLRNE